MDEATFCLLQKTQGDSIEHLELGSWAEEYEQEAYRPKFLLPRLESLLVGHNEGDDELTWRINDCFWAIKLISANRTTIRSLRLDALASCKGNILVGNYLEEIIEESTDGLLEVGCHGPLASDLSGELSGEWQYECLKLKILELCFFNFHRILCESGRTISSSGILDYVFPPFDFSSLRTLVLESCG